MVKKDAIKFVEKKIDELEQQVYVFETVMMPRYERDKEILQKMKMQRDAMKGEVENGSGDDVPAAFR